MFAKLAVAIAAIVLSATAALAADPVGTYMVRRTYPGGGNYSGSAVVERTGNTYRVTWNIGGQTFVGTGVANDEGFAAYRAGSQPALALYGPKSIHWEGSWIYINGREVGTEFLYR
jgi:hypothetical protein